MDYKSVSLDEEDFFVDLPNADDASNNEPPSLSQVCISHRLTLEKRQSAMQQRQ